MGSFSELTKQVHLLNDLILTDMVCTESGYDEMTENFCRHLYATKYWFMRTSFACKKRFVITLINDMRNIWALSLILKSIWNCHTKDVVLSLWNYPEAFSSYDQIPLDHNRTAKPVKSLVQIMNDERRWFHNLDPESQATMILELLYISGSPLMWEVFRIAQLIFEHSRDMQLQDILESSIVVDQLSQPSGLTTDQTKDKDALSKSKAAGKLGTGDEENGFTTGKASPSERAQKNLEASQEAWNAVMKTIRDSQKLEEMEMTFNDGTTQKIWKVNRPKPEVIETVDFLQLLPSTIAKRILSLLPANSLGEYARVNKYWAYLVEDMHYETLARNKLNQDMERLQEFMLKHDTSINSIAVNPTTTGAPASITNGSIAQSLIKNTTRKDLLSIKASEKFAFSSKFFLEEKMTTAVRTKPKPIQNLAELQKRLDRRGAADENLDQWCHYVIKVTKAKKNPHAGILRFSDKRFPTPLMKYDLDLPLDHTIKKDPAVLLTAIPKFRKNLMEETMDEQKETRAKRFSMWSRNFSSLYKVLKIASYETPI